MLGVVSKTYRLLRVNMSISITNITLYNAILYNLHYNADINSQSARYLYNKKK